MNRIILDRMQSDVSLIPELARHIIAAGGKRVRPILTLLSARLCGYRGSRQLALAACVEFIHTATLLHDDVVDDSGLRRGSATANAVWGNKAPVLVGEPGAPRLVADVRMPGGGRLRAELAEVRRIEDVVLLRYALSARFEQDEPRGTTP